MRPLTLCRERLDRIQRILSMKAGSLPVREFARSFSVWEWEIEEAAALGFIKIEMCKPRTGRPSRIVWQVSSTPAAKLPPYRCQIEKPIVHSHRMFALLSVGTATKGGRSSLFSIPPYTDAYLRVFPDARKRRAATASMSRLLRHPHVRAARAWIYAKINQEIPPSDPIPETESGIWQRLREAGSWRAQRITVIKE
jgi:hypothetical protein